MKIQVVLINKGTLEKIEGTRLWRVVEPYIWELRNGTTKTIEIKKGFLTDFGSIPRILWSIFNPTEYNSYILHDYLYKYHTLSRSKSDTALEIGLLSEGAHGLYSFAIWVGVRIGGWIYYNKHKKGE